MLSWSVLIWHIGDVIRKFREAYPREDGQPGGLTRKELADKAGIRQNTLGDVERNVSNFERETLAKIAIALNVTVDGLYAELPSIKLPPNTDPVDAETIARFLKLEREQRDAVRVVVDQFGLFPDRKRSAPDEDHATQPQATPRSGP